MWSLQGKKKVHTTFFSAKTLCGKTGCINHANEAQQHANPCLICTLTANKIGSVDIALLCLCIILGQWDAHEEFAMRETGDFPYDITSSKTLCFGEKRMPLKVNLWKWYMRIDTSWGTTVPLIVTLCVSHRPPLLGLDQSFCPYTRRNLPAPQGFVA